MRYYISDLHFYHVALNTGMDRRGFDSVEAMNTHMIEQWNGKVSDRDEVIILGDLSFGKGIETNKIIDRLKGKLYLIEGNHDKRFLDDKEFDRSRFGWIRHYKELNDDHRKVVLCHYPIICYNGQYRVDENGDPKTYMLYGHVHDTQDQRLVERFQDITRATPHPREKLNRNSPLSNGFLTTILKRSFHWMIFRFPIYRTVSGISTLSISYCTRLRCS